MAVNKVTKDYNDRRKAIFLKNLVISTKVNAAARAAKIPLSTVYRWRHHDSQFADDWDAALTTGFALLEMEMLERARHGTERMIFHQGRHVATVQEHNDALSLRLLTAHRANIARKQALAAAKQADANGGQAAHIRQTLEQKLSNMHEKLRSRRQVALGQSSLASGNLPADPPGHQPPKLNGSHQLSVNGQTPMREG